MYVSDHSQLNSSVVHNTVDDFSVTSVAGSGATGIISYCSGFELLRNPNNQIDGITDKAALGGALDTNEYSISSTISGINNTWFQVRCGVSYDKTTIYSLVRSGSIQDYQEKSINGEMIYRYSGTNYYNNTFFRKTYRGNKAIQVHFKNFYNLVPRVSIRNYLLFRELIPFDIKLEYLYFIN